jgi:hypothetical protein
MQVLDMSISMSFAENFQLLAFLEIFALPTTIYTLISAANPDFAVRRPSPISAGSLASGLYQSAQYFMACWIAFKDIEKRNFGEGFHRFVESGTLKLFSQVPAQVCHLACMQKAVIAVQAAKGNSLQVIFSGLHRLLQLM